MNRVVAVSRNCAFIQTPQDGQIEIALTASNRKAVVGDVCELNEQKNSFKILPRQNLLMRSYGQKKKTLAANINHLFIVTAVSPGINTLFIDRTLSSCIYEGISASILLNKSDIDYSEAKGVLDIYKDIGANVQLSCTKMSDGCVDIEQFIHDKKFHTVALCGISGVGKSSLINILVPNAQNKVGTLSAKGNSGKQTTTMAKLFATQTPHGHPYSVIDLPGLQHFGICHIPLESLADTFTEFLDSGEQCRFNDCSHTTEPDCAVLQKLLSGKISHSRYASYLDMRNEILSTVPSYGKSN